MWWIVSSYHHLERPWEHLEHHADHDEHHPEHCQDPDRDWIHKEGEGAPLGILGAGHWGLHLVHYHQEPLPKHENLVTIHAQITNCIFQSFNLYKDWPALADVEELAAHAVLLAGPALLVSLAVVIESHSSKAKYKQKDNWENIPGLPLTHSVSHQTRDPGQEQFSDVWPIFSRPGQSEPATNTRGLTLRPGADTGCQKDIR